MSYKLGQMRKYRVVVPVEVIVEVAFDKGLYGDALWSARERLKADGYQVASTGRPTVTPVDLESPETD